MYIVFDLIESEYVFVDTEQAAKDQADKWMKHYKDGAWDEGWPEDIEGSVGYAKIIADSRVTKTETKADYGDEPWPYLHDEIRYVDIVPVKEDSNG